MFASLREGAARADVVYMALAFAVYVVSVPIVALRWRMVLGGVTGVRPPLKPLTLATLASGFVNNVTPTRLGGEACRIVALVHLRLATVSQATAAAAYERLSEAPAIATIAIVTLLVVGRIPYQPMAIAGAAVCIGVALLARPIVARGWRRLRARWHRLDSIAISPRTLAAATAMSALIWTLDVVRLRLAAAAFHAPIGLAEAATLSAITIVASLVPTIGGLGPIEGGLVAGLIALGVSPADAIGITVVERSISYGVSTLAGFGALSLLGGRSLWKAVHVDVPVAEGAAT